MSLITISESVGCGGMTVAGLVADNLKLELYDDRRLEEEAVKMGIRSEDLTSLDEKVLGLFDRLLSKKPEIYLDLMEAVVYEVAKRGNGVINLLGDLGRQLRSPLGTLVIVNPKVFSLDGPPLLVTRWGR